MAFLAPHLIRFITTSIGSIPFLEALLLIHSNLQRDWSPQAISTRLYISEKESAALLEQLAESGMAQRSSQGYRYAPRTAELGRLIDELESAYAKNLIRVTRLVHSSVEQNAARFSDAFRLRKD